MNKPLLSIVIANYNYGRFLEEAIQSVLSQSCNDYELIIVDGGSTDNSVEIIKKYEDKIAWWVSEKDKGQSDAFNKGFSRAKGRFLTWLNADDILMPGALQFFAAAVVKYPTCEWFVGGSLWIDKELKVIRCNRGRGFSVLRAKSGFVSVWGPSSFFTKELYERAGRINENFFYTMDSDLWYRFYFDCHVRYRCFATYVWGLRLHECAKMSGHNFMTTDELKKAKHKWSVIANERATMYLKVKPVHKLKWVFTLVGTKWGAAFMSRIDTKKFQKQHYMEMFK